MADKFAIVTRASTGIGFELARIADALRDEIKEAMGVTVTTLIPARVETEFFNHADMLEPAWAHRKSGAILPMPPAMGGTRWCEAHAHIVSGWTHKIHAAMAHVTPAAILAEHRRKMAQPGSALHDHDGPR